MFKQADADGDLKVPFIEFASWVDHNRADISARMFARKDQTITESDVRRLFQELDVNKDGAITRAEAGCKP